MTAGSPEEDSDDDEVPQSTLLRLRRPMGLGLTQQNAVSEVIAETHSAALISGAPLSPGDRILRIDGISVDGACLATPRPQLGRSSCDDLMHDQPYLSEVLSWALGD